MWNVRCGVDATRKGVQVSVEFARWFDRLAATASGVDEWRGGRLFFVVSFLWDRPSRRADRGGDGRVAAASRRGKERKGMEAAVNDSMAPRGNDITATRCDATSSASRSPAPRALSLCRHPAARHLATRPPFARSHFILLSLSATAATAAASSPSFIGQRDRPASSAPSAPPPSFRHAVLRVRLLRS